MCLHITLNIAGTQLSAQILEVISCQKKGLEKSFYLIGGERGIISYFHVLHPFGASFAVQNCSRQFCQTLFSGSNHSAINKYRVVDPVFIYWRCWQSAPNQSPYSSLLTGKIQGIFTIYTLNNPRKSSDNHSQ